MYMDMYMSIYMQMCMYMYVYILWIYLILKNRNLTSFIKYSKYKNSRNSVGCKSCCVMRTDRWTDTTTLVVSLHSYFANAPNVYLIFISLPLYEYYFRNSSRSSFRKCNFQTGPVSFNKYNAPNRGCSCKVIFKIQTRYAASKMSQLF